MKKAALGRGLDVLIAKKEVSTVAGDLRVVHLDVGEIKSSRFQPRYEFREEALRDLKRSIVEKGVIQPIVVRKTTDGYHLIAGERRLRAAREAGINKIPAIVREVEGDGEHLEISLVENIQREDLNPIEKARGYRRLKEEFGLTQDQIAGHIGQERSTVANTLRLLELEEEIQAMISRDEIGFGQAKVLLSIPDAGERLKYARLIKDRPTTVRELETMVSRRPVRSKKAGVREKDLHVRNVESDLREIFQTRVLIREGRGSRGRIEIEYYNRDDRERLLALLKKLI